MKKPVACIIFVLIFSGSACSKHSTEDPLSGNPYLLYRESYKGILGTYASPPRFSDASINTGFPVVLDIYASPHSSLGATTPEYVREALIAGMKSADGVLIYCHQDPVQQSEKYHIIKQGFTDYSQYNRVK